MFMSLASAPYVCSLNVAVTSCLYVYKFPSSPYVCLFRVLCVCLSRVYISPLGVWPPPLYVVSVCMSSPYGVYVSLVGMYPLQWSIDR